MTHLLSWLRNEGQKSIIVLYTCISKWYVLGLLEIKEILDQKNIYLNIKLWPIKFSVLSIGVFGKLIACILFCDFNSLKSLHVYIHTFRWKTNDKNKIR